MLDSDLVRRIQLILIEGKNFPVVFEPRRLNTPYTYKERFTILPLDELSFWSIFGLFITNIFC